MWSKGKPNLLLYIENFSAGYRKKWTIVGVSEESNECLLEGEQSSVDSILPSLHVGE
jgi:hypothetical protein